MPVQDQGETSKAENITAGEAAKGPYPRAGMFSRLSAGSRIG
jgi:hypothetical protein